MPRRIGDPIGGHCETECWLRDTCLSPCIAVHFRGSVFWPPLDLGYNSWQKRNPTAKGQLIMTCALLFPHYFGINASTRIAINLAKVAARSCAVALSG